jgi:hypothetical protein
LNNKAENYPPNCLTYVLAGHLKLVQTRRVARPIGTHARDGAASMGKANVGALMC